MKFHKLICLAAVVLAFNSCRSSKPNTPIAFDPMSTGPSGITLKKYFDRQDAAVTRKETLVSVVKIQASIPNLSKVGEMVAEKSVAPNGHISYEMKSYLGDTTIKKDVIGRYLSSEQEASEAPTIGISPQNYRFKFKRRDRIEERSAVVFELNPRKNAMGLFKGELWLEEDSGLTLRETGRLVKNPSVIFKTLEFTRDYTFKNGLQYLAFQDSRADTRVIGKVLVKMTFDEPKRVAATAPATHSSLIPVQLPVKLPVKPLRVTP